MSNASPAAVIDSACVALPVSGRQHDEADGDGLAGAEGLVLAGGDGDLLPLGVGHGGP